MEKLLLVGLIAALPMAIIGLIGKISGNPLMGFLLYKLPSILVITTLSIYLLKQFKII
jgi:hypothetical protein